MFWTSIRSAAAAATTKPTPDISTALRKILPQKLPPSIAPASNGNLYQLLSRTPTGGVGKHVYQTRWSRKQISDCYWVVTRTKFKGEGQHGKAWGKLVWRGKGVSPREERIRGSLKYKWAEGKSVAGGVTAEPTLNAS